jgi:hypothetical protein
LPTALAPFDHRRHRILIAQAVDFGKTIEVAR